jgi:hypothetical protein
MPGDVGWSTNTEYIVKNEGSIKLLRKRGVRRKLVFSQIKTRGLLWLGYAV